MAKKKKKIFIGIGVALLIGVIVIVNLKRGRGNEIGVQLGKVKRGDIQQVVSGSGRVQPELEVKISANVGAKILKLGVKEGDRVQRGQLLVELDRARYEALTERARSALRSSEANLRKARSEYRRMKELFAKDLISEAELETALASFELAQSQVEQNRASLKQARDDLEKTTIYAPMAGTVSQLNKEEGEIALGAQFQADVIMVVADLSRMEILSEIDENDIVDVSLGDTARIDIDAFPDTTFLGIVGQIANTGTTRGRGTQEELTNFEVKVAILDRVPKIRPGMSATVDIETELNEDVLKVPIQCVTVREIGGKKGGKPEGDEGGNEIGTEKENLREESRGMRRNLQQVVFVVENGVAHQRPVKTGISDDTFIEVTEGLKEGDQVVTGSYRVLTRTLKDGSLVKEEKKKFEMEK